MKRPGRVSLFALLFLIQVLASALTAATPPVLNSVFPCGGQQGHSLELKVSGTGLDEVSRLICSHSDVSAEKISEDRFRVSIPASVPVGTYDLRVLCRNGLSSPRSFVVGNRSEVLESEPNEKLKSAQDVSLDVSINGCVSQKGDVDVYRFQASQGQRVVLECRAERIDSSLNAILEVFDPSGRRLAVNRGFFGNDPLISFRVPADGTYKVKVFDLIYSGSPNHFYRLDIDTGPRMLFTIPPVIQKGETSQVSVYGWNLNSLKSRSEQQLVQDEAVEAARRSLELGEDSKNRQPLLTQSSSTVGNALDRLDLTIKAPADSDSLVVPLRRGSKQTDLESFAFQLEEGHAPLSISLTDLPVVLEQEAHQTAQTAQQLAYPTEVSGQLIAGDEQDWYAFQARRGEVLWFEAWGQRINSPVDLDVSLLDGSDDGSDQKVLARFTDHISDSGGRQFSLNHLDPVGKWVVPEDGRYLIMVRDLRGGLDDDPRRVYRFSLRRQEPEFHLAVVPHHQKQASLNIERGGRTLLDVYAIRKRGMEDSIRISALNLPPGIECPDVWLGPNTKRALLTVSASESAPAFVENLQLKVSSAQGANRRISGGTLVRTDLPNTTSRLTTAIPLAVTNTAPVKITANPQLTRKHDLFGEMKLRHAPGSVLDVAVQVDRRDLSDQAEVKLQGVGLPQMIQNQSTVIPAGVNKGYLSFYLPPYLPEGHYTLTIQAETEVTNPESKKKTSVKLFSNPVSFEVKPAAFVVAVDTGAPRKIRRGETIQVKYSARRMNGFISKIHTELEAPAVKVDGLRVRGVTFVGQTEEGTLQIIANDDAPLGKQAFIRLSAVGVVEDQAVYQGSCFLDLEITD
ncbi:PPC domain-containing protein [Gimesia panareensis]|uniref:PPC domain-containing protein n=1 Tax=Gimesia panareensis TaxID=2527978 RepID=UPI0018D72034|nr:PPC domain-containing protein [Gimesia panareensis]